MDKKRKTYQLEIFGERYSLVSDESERHVINAAQLVDKYMREIAENVAINSQQRIAVLAAIRIASILLYKEAAFKEQQQHANNIIEEINKELPPSNVSS